MLGGVNSGPGSATIAADRANPLSPEAWELVSLTFAAIAGLFFYFAGVYIALNVIGPTALLVIFSLASWRFVRRQPAALWTPLFAFRVSAAIFLGIGGLLPQVIGPEAEVVYLAQYSYTEAEAAKVHLIWVLGSTLTIFGCWIAAQISPTLRWPDMEYRLDAAATLRLGLVFFLAGWLFNALIELPIALGLIGGAVLPAAVALPFQAALAVGVYLISMWGLERKRFAYLAVAAAVASSSMLGFISMYKEGVILPLLFFGLAVLTRRVTALRVLGVATLLVGAFTVLQPMVAYARDRANQSPDRAASFEQRLGFYEDYFAQGAIEDGRSRELDFLRVAHTHAATLIVSRYDTGFPSDDIDGSLIAVVPRAIWPDKPELTGSGEEIFYLMSGTYGSSVAATIFADIYWNIGWWGVLLLSLVWGALMWVGSKAAYRIVASRDWIMMPFVLIMFQIPLALERTFVATVLLPTIMAVVAFYGLKALKVTIAGSFKSSNQNDLLALSPPGAR